MWIPTGSTLLNLAISQHPYQAFKAGRVHRICGESSASKTGLAASAFFLGALYLSRQNIPFKFIYDDTEQSFDVDYYRKAYPFMDQFLDESIFVLTGDDASRTIEDFAERVVDLCKECEAEGKLGFYFVDSLDAIPPAEELKRFEKDGLSVSINPALKASLLSQFFQDNVDRLYKSNVGLVMVSQIRDVLQMGPARGVQTKRVSGGHAVTFYSSLIVYLKQKKAESISLGAGKQGQATGLKLEATETIDIEFKVTKNKLGKPFLSGFFSFVVSSGAIDDVRDIAEFLKQVGYFKQSGAWVEVPGVEKKLQGKGLYDYVRENIKELREVAAHLFNDQLDKMKQLTDISELW